MNRWLFLGCALPIVSFASYTSLPNTELPPDTPLSPHNYILWKGITYDVLNGTITSGNPSSFNTGALVLTPITNATYNSDFPAGESSNLLYRAFAETSLGSSPADSWVRVYAVPPTYTNVTDNGVPTSYVDSDFLLYSKEASGSGTAEPGWYIGPSYSYPLTGSIPAEFATVNTGSFVVLSSGETNAVTSSLANRNSSTQFVLTAASRTGDSGSASGLSTFFWTPQIADSQVGLGAVYPGSFNGLGGNFQILSQVAEYADYGTSTAPQSSDTISEIYTVFTGTGGFFNRDPNAGDAYQPYTSVPNLLVEGSFLSLSENSYYQYINAPISGSPSEISEGGLLEVPSSSLLEFTGDLKVLGSSGVSGGTVLFSGTSNTLTVDPVSSFSADLLVVETELLTLATTSDTPVTISSNGFDLEYNSQIYIDSNVTFLTTPGTTWHSVGGRDIPAVPAITLIQGGGTLSMGTPLSTATPGLWSNFGNISPYNVILTATTADTTFYNEGFFATSNLTIGSSSHMYHWNNGFYSSAGNFVLNGPFTLDAGTLSATTLTINASSPLVNQGTLLVGTMNVVGSSVSITPGFMTVTTLNQGSLSEGSDLSILGSDNSLNVTTWNANVPIGETSSLTLYSGVSVDDFSLNGGTLYLDGILGYGSPRLSITDDLYLAPGSTLTFDDVVQLDLSCSISGDETSSIRGEAGSTLTISGNTSFSGFVSVSADNIVFRVAPSVFGSGILIADSSMSVYTNTNLALDDQITLESHGYFTVGGSIVGPGNIVAVEQGVEVLDDGFLQAGNDVGEILNITGNLTFDPGASLVTYVDVNSNGSSTIEVEGTVTLTGANLTLFNNSGDFHNGQTWTILTADTIVGDFASINVFETITSGYALFPSISGDPTYYVTVKYVNPMNAGVSAGNPLATANAFQTVLNADCAESNLAQFISYDLIPSLIEDTTSPSAIYSRLSGAEYAAIPEAWNETQLQSLIPWQQWMWQESGCEENKKHSSLFSAMVGGSDGGSSKYGQAKWSGVNAMGTVGLTQWHWGRNALVIGVQNEWMGTHVSNAAKGNSRLQTFEAVLAGSVYGSNRKYAPYASFLIGGGGGYGQLKRNVHFDGFSAELKGDFSLATWKGLFETGLYCQSNSLRGEAYATVQNVGTVRYGFKEKSAIGLSSKSKTFNVLRTGLGGRFGNKFLTSKGSFTPQLSALGYFQNQANGKEINLNFVEASCGSYTQEAYGISPFGALLTGDLRWQNDKGLSLDFLIASDLSSHIVTYGGEVNVGFCW